MDETVVDTHFKEKDTVLPTNYESVSSSKDEGQGAMGNILQGFFVVWLSRVARKQRTVVCDMFFIAELQSFLWTQKWRLLQCVQCFDMDTCLRTLQYMLAKCFISGLFLSRTYKSDRDCNYSDLLKILYMFWISLFIRIL